MGIFIDWQTTLECVLISLLFAGFMTAVSLEPLGILQSFGYKGARLFSWAGRKSNMAQSRLSLLALASCLSCAVISMCFTFVGHFSAVIGLVGFLIFFVVYIVAAAKHSARITFSLTPRFKRLLAAVWLVFAILVYIVVTLLNFGDFVWENIYFTALKYCVLAVFPLAALPVLWLANVITLAWELPINNSYIKKAKRAVAAAKKDGLKIVGVTGSYGKTSVKNILTHFLGCKYKVLATPASYNTPQGIAKTVNGENLSGYDFFIVEMGACHVGDIAELCAICPPDYSIITGICAQHLESFKTVDNIVKAKGEIISATANDCYIQGDVFDYFKHMSGAIHCVDCVSNVAFSGEGTSFTLYVGGKKRSVSTKLLGSHSARNIGLSAYVAEALGVGADDICKAIPALEFTEHRLQLIKSNGVYILDDGYNSNVIGARAALDVLKSFGGRKIVVTPGLVELGVLETGENKSLGAELVGLDNIILVGETQVTAVRDGYSEAGGDLEKVTLVPSLCAAQDVLKGIVAEGAAVLFLNDVPAKYL